MTVVDAAWVVEALAGPEKIDIDALSPEELSAPSMIRAEVASALRAKVGSNRMTASAAAASLRTCLDLELDLHPIEPHLERIWDLRHNVTPYDAWYVALAEALDAPLLTTDARLSRAPGIRCEVRVV